MNQCMMLHATQEEHDAARTEWFATIEQRQEEREKRAEKRKKDEKFWRDWWDKSIEKMPSQDVDGDKKG